MTTSIDGQRRISKQRKDAESGGFKQSTVDHSLVTVTGQKVVTSVSVSAAKGLGGECRISSERQAKLCLTHLQPPSQTRSPAPYEDLLRRGGQSAPSLDFAVCLRVIVFILLGGESLSSKRTLHATTIPPTSRRGRDTTSLDLCKYQQRKLQLLECQKPC